METDQYHLDQLTGAIDNLVAPLEKGTEELSQKQRQQLMADINRLVRYLAKH